MPLHKGSTPAFTLRGSSSQCVQRSLLLLGLPARTRGWNTACKGMPAGAQAHALPSPATHPKMFIAHPPLPLHLRRLLKQSHRCAAVTCSTATGSGTGFTDPIQQQCCSQVQSGVPVVAPPPPPPPVVVLTNDSCTQCDNCTAGLPAGTSRQQALSACPVCNDCSTPSWPSPSTSPTQPQSPLTRQQATPPLELIPTAPAPAAATPARQRGGAARAAAMGTATATGTATGTASRKAEP